ncbi:MAG TPA: hypothetical protein VH744_00045, partial [Terriglobales bacterium]
MGTLLVGVLLVTNALFLLLLFFLLRRSSPSEALGRLANQADALQQTLGSQFASATADMAMRLEQTKGDLRQQVTDRLADGFTAIRNSVEDQLLAGRREQAERLAEARTELTGSLALTTTQLKSEFDVLNQRTTQNL